MIATAFIKKALDWPAVKDAKGIDEFALFLVECQNAAESMESNSVLDYPDNIKRLVQKLPINMHDRWQNVVLRTKNAKGRVHFKDFVTFVKTEAKKSNDSTCIGTDGWSRIAHYPDFDFPTPLANCQGFDCPAFDFPTQLTYCPCFDFPGF